MGVTVICLKSSDVFVERMKIITPTLAFSKMKYRRSLAGKPFTKDPPFTRGFEEGVGYTKNFMRANPTMAVCTVLTLVSGAIMAGRWYYDSLRAPEEKFQFKPRYTVKRLEDDPNPDKPVFN